MFFKTAESTGMRDSEICGMTTEYTETKEKMIYVWRSVVGSYNDKEERIIEIKTDLKSTLSRRMIQTGDKLNKLLADHIAGKSLVPHTDGKIYLFQKESGEPYHPAYFSKVFSDIVKRLIKDKKISTQKGLHNLRHFHATTSRDTLIRYQLMIWEIFLSQIKSIAGGICRLFMLPRKSL